MPPLPGNTVQVPTSPARLQKSQEPPQALLQHTPSAQLPLAHWLPPVQAAPLLSFGTQALPLQ